MADRLALLLALLNWKSEELGSNPGSAPLFAFALRLKPREGKAYSQDTFGRVRLAGLDHNNSDRGGNICDSPGNH